ncbi:electron transport complex subunit RsxC [bacterium]|nr:MAG: electron transport complex subunit RsxC [bacterium]
MGITFKGGIHPPENKHFTENKSLEKIDAPEVLYVPLSQHIGAPANPIVKKGDEVKMGQKIAEASGFISANIHSPVSGKVKSIEDIPHFLGSYSPAVVIENDGEDTPAEELEPHTDWENLPPEEFAKIAGEAGIVGMGGATFPTQVKLSPPKDKKIDTVILNGAECEPYLTADHRLMLEYPQHIIEGALMIKYALGAKRLIMAIENNKPDAIEIMRKTIGGDDIEVAELKTKYPQGAEKQLINALTGLEVPSGGLPFDVGCYVQNVGTAKAIRDAVIDGIPLVERVVTVSGLATENPGNFLVRIGTPISRLLEIVGTTTEVGKVIMGGPMMGIAQWTLQASVTKGTSGVLFFPAEQSKIGDETACILCANCVDICPARLLPTSIAHNAKYGKFNIADRLGANDCIECGSCAFICPANINLLQYIRWAKAEIKQMAKK